MLVLGFDVETTGLDFEQDNVIELGAALWDTTRGIPVQVMSKLICVDKPLDPKITELTGITDDDLRIHGVDFHHAVDEFFILLTQCEAVVAHNGNTFDKPMLLSNVTRQTLNRERNLELINKSLWIDTMCDVDYPAHIQTRKLSHLAAEHGFLNPFKHRALFDVLTMMNMAQTYDWSKIILNAKTPNVTLIAKVSFDQRELAKKLNYRWNPDNKSWFKVVKEHAVEIEKEAATQLGFSFRIDKSDF